jgi:hypothetical protein
VEMGRKSEGQGRSTAKLARSEIRGPAQIA